MTCPHITASTKEYNVCDLKLYGGKPSHGTCDRCIERNENTATYAQELKRRAQMLARFGHAAGRFIRHGAPTTPPEVLAQREATCRACPEWDSAALNGTGRCRKCGCSTWAKLRMATEACPIGKWKAISSPSVTPVSSVVNRLPAAPEATRKPE